MCTKRKVPLFALSNDTKSNNDVKFTMCKCGDNLNHKHFLCIKFRDEAERTKKKIEFKFINMSI